VEVLKTEKNESTSRRYPTMTTIKGYLKNIHHPLNLEMTLPNVWREGAFHFNKNIRNNLLLFIEHTPLFFTSVTKAENSATVNSK
jgi:hypothetical protein